MGVDDDETFTWIIARELPLRVVNLGVLGYGTDQALLALEEYLAASPEIRVKEIVVLLFENDFLDVQRSVELYLARTKPRFRSRGGLLERSVYSLTPTDRLMDGSKLFWLLRSRW